MGSNRIEPINQTPHTANTHRTVSHESTTEGLTHHKDGWKGWKIETFE